MEGWVSIHRRIMKHWLYEEKRVFSRFEAWIDLVLLANYEDSKVMIDGQMKTVHRGQHLTSIRKLCERWRWSNTKVVAFLDLLEKEGMIVRESDNKKTLITLVNYEKYQNETTQKRRGSLKKNDTETTQTTTHSSLELQGIEDFETTQKRHKNDTETTQIHTNNNINNNNNLNKYKDIVPFDEIIEYLNAKTGKQFRVSQVARQHINARWREGFRLEHFKTVIDKKTAEWLDDPRMEQYLRPQTLFGTKFESYLNQKVVIKGGGAGAKYGTNPQTTQPGRNPAQSGTLPPEWESLIIGTPSMPKVQ